MKLVDRDCADKMKWGNEGQYNSTVKVPVESTDLKGRVSEEIFDAHCQKYRGATEHTKTDPLILCGVICFSLSLSSWCYFIFRIQV